MSRYISTAKRRASLYASRFSWNGRDENGFVSRFPFPVSRLTHPNCHNGIFPCFFRGTLTLLFSRSPNAWMSFSLVSDGSMIWST